MSSCSAAALAKAAQAAALGLIWTHVNKDQHQHQQHQQHHQHCQHNQQDQLQSWTWVPLPFILENDSNRGEIHGWGNSSWNSSPGEIHG